MSVDMDVFIIAFVSLYFLWLNLVLHACVKYKS